MFPPKVSERRLSKDSIFQSRPQPSPATLVPYLHTHLSLLPLWEPWELGTGKALLASLRPCSDSDSPRQGEMVAPRTEGPTSSR